MTHDEMIAVIQAYKRGERIEFKHKSIPDDEWTSVYEPLFNFTQFDYRVKPAERKVTLKQTIN